MPSGACLLVLGPSGSGKSTLALALGGLLPRQRPGTWEGRLSVDGLDVSRAPGPEIAGRVGLLFQDPSSQLVMDRVQDDVAFGLENRGWRAADMHLRVPEALIEVGLADQARARVATLSGGQQQRVALAGVLAPRPGLLVLDEPTANLDPPAARALVAELAAIRQRRSATVVLIEHRVELVWGLADLLLVLGADGRPMAFGAPGVVIERSGQAMAHAGVWLPRAVEERLGPDGRTPAVRVRPDGSNRPDPGGPPERRHALVEARGLDFAYERDAAVRRSRAVVRDVSLRVRSGERIALVGPNASGKSTLAKLLVGLLKPARGSVELFADAPDGATPRGGAPPDRMPAAVLARRAGYVFQDPERQFLTSRLLDEVMLGLRPEERAGVPTLMESLGLPLADFAARSPYALSGGEQRRLSLACSLVRRPGLLVLDEPTFGQDRLGYESLLSMLHDRIVTGAAVIAATHDERFVADFGRRVVRLAEGRVVEDRVVDDTQQPATATVERKTG